MSSVSDWMVFLSAIGSAIGAATGIVGAITGISSARKVQKMTVLDLRMRHGDIYSSVQVHLDAIRELCSKANQSKIYRLAAQGLGKSGVMEKWKDEYNGYVKQTNALSIEFRGFSGDNSFLSSEKMASEIVGISLIQKRIQALNDTLRDSLSEDDAIRDRLRKDGPWIVKADRKS